MLTRTLLAILILAALPAIAEARAITEAVPVTQAVPRSDLGSPPSAPRPFVSSAPTPTQQPASASVPEPGLLFTLGTALGLLAGAGYFLRRG